MLNDNTNNKMSLAIVMTTKTRAQWRTEADSRVLILHGQCLHWQKMRNLYMNHIIPSIN